MPLNSKENTWVCPSCGRCYALGMGYDDFPNECECGVRPTNADIAAILAHSESLYKEEL